MHDYSIDGHPKDKIFFILAFVAIALAPVLNAWIALLVEKIGASEKLGSAAVTAVPVFGLFALVYYLFNSHFWKWRLLRKILLVPDLNGIWRCDGQTTLKRGQRADVTWEGTVTITQSWSKILIHLKTATSSSRSVAASLYRDPGVGYRLLYQYENDPQANQLDLAKHSGSSEILIPESCLEASGHYFTDQHRNTVGIMNWNKVLHAPSS